MSHQARNTQKNIVTLLGSGTSTGVPIIGCKCDICTSEDPRDKRLRMSILLQTAKGKTILVDTSPDMRTQMLRQDVNSLDAVIITHAHADHIHGIDDLRSYSYKRQEPLNVYTNESTAKILIEKFDYIFNPFKVFKDRKAPGGGVAKLKLKILDINKVNDIEGEDFYISELPHGIMKTISFIHEGFAYLTDGSAIPEDYLVYLKNTKPELMLLDCASKKPHNTHLHFDKSLKYTQQIQARRTGLIHISHVHGHQQLEQRYKEDASEFTEAFVAYDQLELHY